MCLSVTERLVEALEWQLEVSVAQHGIMAAAATSAPSTVDKSVLEFQTYLARRSGYTPSYNLASKTVEVMRTVITSRRWSNAE